MIRFRKLLPLLLLGLLLMMACEPLVPTPTPQVIVITATASPAPTATVTLTPSPTLDVTATPTPTETPTPVFCDDTAGQIFTFEEFESDIAGRNMPYRVYVPPCYFASQRRYPVVYLLHGAGETEAHWQEVGLVETLDRGLALNQYPPMIVVMPWGGLLLPSDEDWPPASSLETYLLDELIPRIEYDFCVVEDRAYRAIGGISRGGFWALSIAMRHPDLFSAVGAHSPELQTDTPADFDPQELALTAPFLDTLRFYLDHGGADLVEPGVQQFSSRLVQRQIPHEYIPHPLGDHSNEYWGNHVAEYLAFYGGTAADGWPRAAETLPTCLEPSP